MKSQPLYRIACGFLAAVLFLPVLAQAQYTPLSDKLATISDELFRNGNENYILVDAVKDGILVPGKQYNISILPGSITFNEKPLEQSANKVYEEKMKKFFEANNGGNTAVISLRGSKITMDEILDEHSTFRSRKVTFKPRNATQDLIEANVLNGKRQTEYTDRIIKEMVKDKLVKDKDKLKIKWNMTGVYVNDKKLKGWLADKYNTMFEKETGFIPLKMEDGVVITRND